MGGRCSRTSGWTPEAQSRICVSIKELLGSEQIVYFNIGENKCCAKLNTDFAVGNEFELSLSKNDFLYFDKETGERLV